MWEGVYPYGRVGRLLLRGVVHFVEALCEGGGAVACTGRSVDLVQQSVVHFVNGLCEGGGLHLYLNISS